MKKICFFVASLNSGGIENYLLRFLQHYEGKFEATVYCKGGEFGELENQYRKLTNTRLVNSNIGYFNVLAYYDLFEFLKKEKFHSVCDFTGNFAGMVLWIAYLVEIKIRIVFYRGSSNRFKETTFRLIYNQFVNLLVKKYATSILSNSKTALIFFFKKRDDRFNVIYNGIESKSFEIADSKEQIRRELGIPTTAFVVGHTGRVHYSKNHETILKVATQICSKNPDIQFVLCGKNTDMELPQLVNSDVKNQVYLLGFRSDVPRILKACDVYFFPSVTEGQPNALIEAMISGLPVIASNIEPIKETVPPFFRKDLIDPFDVNSYVNKIEDIYSNKDVRNRCILKDWAISNFNHKKLFDSFFKELV